MNNETMNNETVKQIVQCIIDNIHPASAFHLSESQHEWDRYFKSVKDEINRVFSGALENYNGLAVTTASHLLQPVRDEWFERYLQWQKTQMFLMGWDEK